MADETTFMLRVTTGEQTQDFLLSAKNIEAIISSALEDSAEFAGFYAAAAHHPAAGVRRAAAAQNSIPGDAVLDLADDPSTSVRVQAVCNTMFRRTASEGMVLALIESDPDVADAVAGSVSVFENADIDVICEAISRHPDPNVRRTLAWNSATPVKWLKRLRQDSTREVAETATKELASRMG